jgi:hypothetical protein
VAISAIGLVLVVAVSSLAGFIVVMCGFLISMWSRTIV